VGHEGLLDPVHEGYQIESSLHTPRLPLSIKRPPTKARYPVVLLALARRTLATNAFSEGVRIDVSAALR
jgi:hypothetical protein